MTRASSLPRRFPFLARLAAALAAVALLAAVFLVWPLSPASADHEVAAPELSWVPGVDSVTIHWEHPEPGLRLKGWLVWYPAGTKRNGRTTPEIAMPADGSKTSHTISRWVTTGASYDFQMMICDTERAHNCSQFKAKALGVVIGSPHAPAVSAAPLNAEIDLDVSWEEPEDNGAAVSGYEAQYKRSDAETWTDEGLILPVGHTRRAWIKGLEAGVSYDVRVRAQNSRGWGPWARVAASTPVQPPTAQHFASTTIGFASATYSGDEGDPITIELHLARAQPTPVRVHVRPEYGGAASYESDYSLGDCLPSERSCDFGVGLLYVEIPAGDASWSYAIRTADDHRVEGDESFTLTVYPLSRNAERGDNHQTVITIADNDTAGVEVSEESIAIDEDTSGSYTVKLTSQPAGWVRIYAESAFACKVNVSPGFVDLGPHNWNQPQTFVHVRSWHDYDAADEQVVISHRIETAGNAAEYRAVSADSVTVKVTDKHSPSVIVERTSLEANVGGTARYRVYLNTDPSPVYGASPADCYDYSQSHTVTITATSSDTEIATVSPASVTFTADDYAPKTFTVTALSAGDVAITHAVSGTDPDYTDGTIITQSVAMSVPALQQAPPQRAQEPPAMQQRGPTKQAVAPPQTPGPVLDLELVAAADRLTVSWNAPQTGDAPTRYIAHIKPVGGGKGELKTPKAKKTSVTFRNLEPGQAYKVFVRAKNQSGKGPRSWAVVTLPEAPP